MYLDYYGFKVANLMISFFIVVFNIVIRTFNIAIIDKIGFEPNSQRRSGYITCLIPNISDSSN